MGRIALLAVLFAASAEAAEPVVAPIPAGTMQPGYGIVESIVRVRVAERERSAAAGGSVIERSEARPAYRLAVRMPDGSVQYRDLDRPEFRPGDHVLLTNAGDVVPD